MGLLKVSHISKKFGGVHAVQNCSLQLPSNTITALIGPNGAGKSTLFDLITGLITPDSGSITFKDRDITYRSAWQRARAGIARTFQMIRIFPKLSVLENLMLASPHFRDELSNMFRTETKQSHEIKQKASELLTQVHLHEKAHHKACDISYGQQKLLEILRSLMTDADLFLFDEPAAGVNRTMLHTISRLIRSLKQQGKTILIVEHDMSFVMSMCERIIVMDYGKEIARGTPEEVQNNPMVLEAYLGHKKNP